MTRIRIYLLVLFFAGVFFILPQQVSASGLAISNVKLQGRYPEANTVTVEFDVTWENSWRDSTNYDAVWIFLKVLKNGRWYHGVLASEGVNPTNMSTGSNTDLDLIVPPDKVGAFIQRHSNGTGIVASSKVRLLLNYGAAPLSATDTDTIQVKVFGIEMVYVPTANFYIGDGDGGNEQLYAFHVTDNTAVQLTTAFGNTTKVDAGGDDDAQLTSTGIRIDGDAGVDTNNDGTIDNISFPTGYTSFYLMKYELTQGQYRDFLNSLSRIEQDHRVVRQSAGYYAMSLDGYMTFRQTIENGADPGDGIPYTYGCDHDQDTVLNEDNDGEWIAMNNLSWTNLAAYADWAGLRPMTELEFEKAARGTASAVYDENVWGSTNLTDVGYAYNVTNDGTSSEGVNTTGAGLCADWLDGNPLRAGFAATPSTNREGAGAGYYGNMELGGNEWERAVTLGNSTGRAFLGTHGDGVLHSGSGYEGNATNCDWPGCSYSWEGVTGATGMGLRGGSHDDFNVLEADLPRTSRRKYAARTDNASGPAYGGRLARTADLNAGTKSGSTITQSSPGDYSWGGLTNISNSDDLYASVGFNNGGPYTSNYLKVQNLGFNLDATSRVLGIKVTVEGKVSVWGVADWEAKLLKDGTATSDNKAPIQHWNDTADTVYTYGTGIGDGWGTTWTPSDINDPDFGFELKMWNSSVESEVYVDQITITVYYQDY